MNDENRMSDESPVSDPALEALEAELYDLQSDVDHWIIKSEGYQPKNVMHFFQHKKKWLAMLHHGAQEVSRLDPDNQQRGMNDLAAAYYHLGTACSWTEMWHYAYVILREGMPFAKQAGDPKALFKYTEEMKYYANGPSMTDEIRACQNVAELEALLKADDDIGGKAHRNATPAAPGNTVSSAHRSTDTAGHKERSSLHEEKSEGHGCLLAILGGMIFIVILWLL